VSGLRTNDKPVLSNSRYSDYEVMETFNETGAVDFLPVLTDLDDAYTQLEHNMGLILSEGLLDYTVRAGLSLAGWKPVSGLSLYYQFIRSIYHCSLFLEKASRCSRVNLVPGLKLWQCADLW